MDAASYLNETDERTHRVISDQDYTHRFAISGIYELPFGRGRRWFSALPKPADYVFGGWQLQAWYEGQTGQALGFGNAIFNGNLSDIELPVNQRSELRWFNVDAGFNRNNQQQLANNIRQFPARFNGVRSDGINNLNLSAFKRIRIKERAAIELSFETFNSFNHVQFGNPNTTPTSAAFGSITAEKGHGQRQVTTGIKVKF